MTQRETQEGGRVHAPRFLTRAGVLEFYKAGGNPFEEKVEEAEGRLVVGGDA
jgi:hypothetical protein